MKFLTLMMVSLLMVSAAAFAESETQENQEIRQPVIRELR